MDELDAKYVPLNTILMLHKIPEFDLYYVAYLKDDPAKRTGRYKLQCDCGVANICCDIATI